MIAVHQDAVKHAAPRRTMGGACVCCQATGHDASFLRDGNWHARPTTSRVLFGVLVALAPIVVEVPPIAEDKRAYTVYPLSRHRRLQKTNGLQGPRHLRHGVWRSHHATLCSHGAERAAHKRETKKTGEGEGEREGERGIEESCIELNSPLECIQNSRAVRCGPTSTAVLRHAFNCAVRAAKAVFGRLLLQLEALGALFLPRRLLQHCRRRLVKSEDCADSDRRTGGAANGQSERCLLPANAST